MERVHFPASLVRVRISGEAFRLAIALTHLYGATGAFRWPRTAVLLTYLPATTSARHLASARRELVRARLLVRTANGTWRLSIPENQQPSLWTGMPETPALAEAPA